MRSAPTVLVVVLVAMAAVAAAPTAALGTSTDDATAPATGPSSADVEAGVTSAEDVRASTAADNHSNDSNLSAGQQLSAVVGVGEAEVEGEVEERRFAIQLGNASTDEDRAQVVGENAETIRQELRTVQDRIDDLQRARENGTIGVAEYRARVAPLAARAQTLERQVDATANASEGIPADALEANGVNASAIQELKDRAGNVSGGEVSEIARSIGGPGTGSPVRGGPPEEIPGGNDTGTPGGDRGDAGNDTDAGGDRGGAGNETDAGGDAGNETGTDAGTGDGTDAGGDAGTDGDGVDPTVENATDRVETARDRVAAAEENVTGDAGSDALDDATTALETAETALETARNATGQERTDHAQEALDEAAAAIEHAETAIDRASGADGGDAGTDGGSETDGGGDAGADGGGGGA